MKLINTEIKNYMKKLALEKYFPGACYAVFYKGHYLCGSVGYRSLIPIKERNNLNTLYDLASLTKLLVTNTLISKLIHEKKLNEKDTFKKHFNKFPFDDITVYHLLTHTSGIKVLYDKNKIRDKDEVLTNLRLEHEPGKDLCYQDINYLLLGFLIEKVYNDTLDNISKKYIFEPLGMKDTGYLPTDADRCAPTELTSARGLLRGIVHDEKSYFLNGIAGNAGVFSTIKDVSRFVRMIINNGKISNREFLNPIIIDSWFKEEITDSKGNGRSIGWVIGSTNKDTKAICSTNSIFHTGYTGNEILIDREKEYAFILLSNRVHPTRDNKKLVNDRNKINKDIFEIVTKGE